MTEAAAQKTADTQAPEADNVSPIDRLPLKEGLGDRKHRHPNNPYWTKRAAEARENAFTYIPFETVIDSRDLLSDAGLRRSKKAYEDMAEHNALTLAAARTYRGFGLHVADGHALYNNGEPTNTGPGGNKVPRGTAWQLRATTDEDKIVSFWTGDGMYPPKEGKKARPYATVDKPRNVSIVYPVACGLFALDVDGEEGQAELAKLEAEHGPLPATPTIMSGSGEGFQMIFRAPVPIRNSASKIAPKIDIRGEGGQSVAPPSVHPSFGFYDWEEGRAPGEVEIADAPEWLVNAAVDATKNARRIRPEGQARSVEYEPREPTGDNTHFEAKLLDIGDDAKGFDRPILSAANAWFFANGWDADASTLFDELQAAILAAYCKDKRKEERYATPEYLNDRIEQARDFVWSCEEEAGEEVVTEGQSDSQEPASAGDEDWDYVRDCPTEKPSRKAQAEARAKRLRKEEAEDAEAEAESIDPYMTLDITAPLPRKADKAVEALEHRFKYVSTGGKAAFLRVADYRKEGTQMEYWPKAALKEYHEDRPIKHNKKWVNPVDVLIKKAKRYSKAEFAPYPVRPMAGSYNLYQGYSLDPKQGNCSRLKDFLKDVICDGDDKLFKWVWLWLAHRVQRPGEKPGTSIVMHGEGGIGKGTFGELLKRLFGPYFITVDSKNQVLGNHSGTRFLTAIVCFV